MSIIIVDGQAWSGREEVASLLARDLRCLLIGGEKLAKWAERRGIDHEEFLERLEQPYGFFRRLGDFIARGLTYSGTGTLGSPEPHTAYPFIPYLHADLEPGVVGIASPLPEGAWPLDIQQMRKLLPSLLLENIGPGHAVVALSGAQGALKEIPDVLKVFLVALPETRAMRASVELDIGLDEARKRVQQVDKARGRFAKQVFGLSWDDSSSHDLYLDTGTLTHGDVVGIILRTMAQDAAAFGDELAEAAY